MSIHAKKHFIHVSMWLNIVIFLSNSFSFSCFKMSNPSRNGKDHKIHLWKSRKSALYQWKKLNNKHQSNILQMYLIYFEICYMFSMYKEGKNKTVFRRTIFVLSHFSLFESFLSSALCLSIICLLNFVFNFTYAIYRFIGTHHCWRQLLFFFFFFFRLFYFSFLRVFVDRYKEKFYMRFYIIQYKLEITFIIHNHTSDE